MVQKLICDCDERIGTEIDSFYMFDELKIFFQRQVEDGVFKELKAKKPYYIGYGGNTKIKWYADKWYKCKSCGCLWEFKYPDFPAKGFIRKFEDGKYQPK